MGYGRKARPEKSHRSPRSGAAIIAHPAGVQNLSCTYCNEFDDFSKPVPLGEMRTRIDRLADLGTSIISFSGGEPLLHPDLDALITHIRRRRAIAGMITNGYLLTAKRIQEPSNAAGPRTYADSRSTT